MKKLIILFLTLSLFHKGSASDLPIVEIAAPRVIKKEPVFRLERQKKVVQAEIEHFHQTFDPKSTLSYDVRYLDSIEKIADKNNQLRLHPGYLVGLATALGALDLLGRDFAFSSTVTIKETPIASFLKKGEFADSLYVDLFLDPHLSYEDLLNLAQQVKQKGITTIDGKIIFADHPALNLSEGWELTENHPLVLYLKGKILVGQTVMDRSQAFIKALKEKGITLKDSSIAYLEDKQNMPKNLIAEVKSPTLIPLLHKAWEEQDKVTFEALVRCIGEIKQRSNKSLRLGLLQIRDFLSLRALLNCDEIALFDGSGTSSLSLLSVKQFTSLLLFAKNQFHLEADLLASLPLMQIKSSMKGPPCFVRAIRTTQGNTVGITGIMETAQKRKIAFCCIVNNANREKEKAESFLQSFCQTLHENL